MKVCGGLSLCPSCWVHELGFLESVFFFLVISYPSLQNFTPMCEKSANTLYFLLIMDLIYKLHLIYVFLFSKIGI